MFLNVRECPLTRFASCHIPRCCRRRRWSHVWEERLVRHHSEIHEYTYMHTNIILCMNSTSCIWHHDPFGTETTVATQYFTLKKIHRVSVIDHMYLIPTLPVPAISCGVVLARVLQSSVDHDKVFEGLRSLHDDGIHPKWLVLDDGWQSTSNIDAANGGSLPVLTKLDEDGSGVNKYAHIFDDQITPLYGIKR